MSVNLFGYICYRKRASRYRSLLEEADDKLSKHLDLMQIIEIRKYTRAALSILLNPRQSKIIKEFSLQSMKLQKRSHKKQLRK